MDIPTAPKQRAQRKESGTDADSDDRMLHALLLVVLGRVIGRGLRFRRRDAIVIDVPPHSPGPIRFLDESTRYRPSEDVGVPPAFGVTVTMYRPRSTPMVPSVFVSSG